MAGVCGVVAYIRPMLSGLSMAMLYLATVHQLSGFILSESCVMDIVHVSGTVAYVFNMLILYPCIIDLNIYFYVLNQVEFAYVCGPKIMSCFLVLNLSTLCI